MKSIIFIITIILTSIVVQAQWLPLNSNMSAGYFTCVQFIDDNTGFVGGENLSGGAAAVLKTVNAGSNWTSLTPAFNGFVRDIHFIDAQTGFICGDNGNVKKTTDGGTTWTTLTTGTSVTIYNIEVIDINNLYISGANSLFGRSVNGGANWMLSTVGTQFNLTMDFVNINTGYICSQYNMFKTTNSGVNWIPQNLYTVNNMNDMMFINETTGYIVGNATQTNGTVRKTIDGGNTWFPNYSNANSYLEGLHMVNVLTGYTSGLSGIIRKTTNGGNTWDSLYSGSSANLNGVWFNNSSTGYVVGSNGTILKTTNSGGITYPVCN